MWRKKKTKVKKTLGEGREEDSSAVWIVEEKKTLGQGTLEARDTILEMMIWYRWIVREWYNVHKMETKGHIYRK
jgi:hypothetical protein